MLIPVSRLQKNNLKNCIKTDYESKILLLDRVMAMTQDLFNYLIETGGPEQNRYILCPGSSCGRRGKA